MYIYMYIYMYIHFLTLPFLQIYPCKHKKQGMAAYIYANFLSCILVFYKDWSGREKKNKNESILYKLPSLPFVQGLPRIKK